MILRVVIEQFIEKGKEAEAVNTIRMFKKEELNNIVKSETVKAPSYLSNTRNATNEMGNSQLIGGAALTRLLKSPAKVSVYLSA
jgi:hypothetical protein